MSTVRVKSGNASATITGLDASVIRRMIEQGTNGAVKILEEALEPVAANARREWYGPNGVERETGKSGDIQVVTTYDLAKSEVRVSVGSTDLSTVAKRSGGGHTDAYRVRYIHRPSSLTLRAKAVSQEDWWAWKRRGLPTLAPPGDPWWSDKDHGRGLARNKWYIQTTGLEDKATVSPNDPTYRLLPDLVTKPAKKAIKAARPRLAAAIAQGASRGG